LERKERLDLTNHFTTGTIRIKHLVQKAKEGAPDAKNARPAVGPFISLGQKLRRQEWAKQLVELEEALWSELANAPPEGSQARAPGWEERSVLHDKYIYLSSLDSQLKMKP
jgi:hypothetical protein